MSTFVTECTNGFFVNANASSITSVGLLDEFVDAVVTLLTSMIKLQMSLFQQKYT